MDARSAYRKSGVNIEAFDKFSITLKKHAQKTAFTGSDTSLNGFGAFFDPKSAGLNDPLFVTACDGVGTKLLLAKKLGIHDTIGIDLVAMCVNDLICHGAKPVNFLDYIAVGTINPAILEAIIEGIAEGCLQSGAALVGGETAEMPAIYGDDEYELAGFTLGAVERGKQLPNNDKFTAGDIVIGLAASGMHSNGYSLVNTLINNGQINLSEKVSHSGGASTAGELLLTPTRIYVNSILQIIDKFGESVRAVANITGGGIEDNIKRVIPNNFTAKVDLSTITSAFPWEWFAKAGELDYTSLHTTYNCGLGMAVVVDSKVAQDIITTLNEIGETAWMAGEINDSNNAQATSRVEIVNSLPRSG